MFNAALSYLKFGNRYYGVEHIMVNEQFVFRVIVLKKTKGSLTLDITHELHAVKEIKEILPKNQALGVVFNNSQVLTKEIVVTSKDQDTHASMLRAFPNIDINDFYYQILEAGNTQYVSIIRKAYVEEVIGEYEKNGLKVINFSIGVSGIAQLLDFIQLDKVVTSEKEILVSSGTVSKIHPATNSEAINYDINGIQLSRFYLLPFSICLDLILQRDNVMSNTQVFKSKLMIDYLTKRYFSLGLKTTLSLIFVVLLVNFLVFNKYFNDNKELQGLVNINMSSKETVLTLQEEVENKQLLVENLSRNSNSNSSFFVNQIVAKLPNSIRLTDLQYQPILKKIRKDKPIQLRSNYTMVSGITKSSDAFSKWIDQIQQQEWVKSLEVVSYSDQTTTSSQFTILISLHNE